MPDPRFSIVIPTRERPHTLGHTIATCLAQQGDFEVVVSDNASSPRTRGVVEACADARVRYVRTPALLAMTESWEFAVAQARGEYVLMIGDDDGLLRHALAVIDRVLRETGTPLLQWESAAYTWPDVRNAHFPADALLLPLRQARSMHALRVCDSRAMMRAAANGHLSYTELPGFYPVAVRRELLCRLRARAGRVFKSRSPDVYSGFALAALVDEYHSLRAPLGICGRSGTSTGLARHFSGGGSPVDDEFRRLNAEAGLELHPWVPDLPPVHSAVADAFLWAKRDLFPHDGETVLDRTLLVRNCLRELDVQTADGWREALARCRRSLADAPELLEWFEREYGAPGRGSPERPGRSHHWRRYGEGYLHLDAAEFGVRDIDGAAGLCERLLGYKRDGLDYRLESFGGGPSLSELQEKEALIQRLHADCQHLQEHHRERVAELDRELEARLDVINRLHAHIDYLTGKDAGGVRGLLRAAARRLLPR